MRDFIAPRILICAGLALLLFLLVGCGSNSPGGETARVVGIVDGDTIKVEMQGQVYRLRYIGMNAPELDTPSGTPEPYAVDAAEANRRLVDGQIVTLEKDISNTDRYGRLLRYVYVGSTFVNAELVQHGLAWSHVYKPDIRLQETIKAAEIQARDAHYGLWSINTPTPTSTPTY
jgi:micrococcal nuclease